MIGLDCPVDSGTPRVSLVSYESYEQHLTPNVLEKLPQLPGSQAKLALIWRRPAKEDVQKAVPSLEEADSVSLKTSYLRP